MYKPHAFNRPRIKSDMRFLSSEALSRIANAIANRYDLPPVVSDRLIEQCYTDPISQPLVLINRHGTLWLDRYYAAYCLSTGEFHYFYLTVTHVFEELSGWQEVANLRHNPGRMPPQIHAELHSALRQMKRLNHSVWVCTREFPIAV